MPIKESTPNAATPSYPELTTVAINGSGVFDQLMESIKLHLSEEYSQQRIKGTDYSKVYMGALEAVLGNSVQYLASTALLDIQKLKLQAEIANIKLAGDKLRFEIDQLLPLQRDQLEAEVIKITQEGLLVVAQVSKTAQEELLMQAQVAKILKENLELLPEQIKLMQAQVYKITEENTKLLPAQIDSMIAQAAKMEKEKQLITAQVEKITIENVKLLPANIDYMVAQARKMGEEELLIKAKVVSEIFNTSDMVDGKDVGGLVKKQQDLLATQTKGFSVDAFQKATKMYLDAFTVLRSTDESHPIYDPFNNAHAKSTLKGLRESLEDISGLTLDPATDNPPEQDVEEYEKVMTPAVVSPIKTTP